MNTEIPELKTYSVYNENYLYNNIEPIINGYKNLEKLNKESSKLKLPRVVEGPDKIKYTLTKQFKLNPILGTSEQNESDDIDSNKSLVDEFILTKIGEITNNMEIFKKAGIITTSNIEDVKFGIGNFCAFISINLAFCSSIKVNHEDVMIKNILSKIIKS